MSNVITNIPDVEGERKRNMIQYSIMMGVRLVCILACFVVPLAWVWVPALVAIFIPMVATMSTTQKRYNTVGSTQLFIKDKELTG